MSVIAIIPARGQSKRLPRKNIIKINNKPTISYSIETAINSKLFDEVFVSTEDKEISNISKSYGAKIINRPKKLSTDKSTVEEVCLHALETIPGIDVFCCIYATAVLVKKKSLINSFKLLKRNPKINFVAGVSNYDLPPLQAMKMNKRGLIKSMWPKWMSVKSQFYPNLVVNNGTIYWARAKAYKLEKKLLGKNTLGFLMLDDEVSDIDTIEDLNKIRNFMKFKKK